MEEATKVTNGRVATTQYRKEDGMALRMEILHVALMVERKAQEFVRIVLEPHVALESLVNWDFNKRIQFLTNLKALSADEKGKFTLFQRFRNELMHNLEANTLTKCFEVWGKDPKDMILNLYPQDEKLEIEDQLWSAVQALVDEIGHLLGVIEEYIKKYVIEQALGQHAMKGFQSTMEAVTDEIIAARNRLGQKQIQGPMSNDEVLQIPDQIFNAIRVEAGIRFRKLVKDEYGIDLDDIGEQPD